MNIGALMKQAQQMQDKVTKMQAEFAAKEFEGASGGGLIKVIILGNKEVKKLTISPELLKDEVEILEDLIVAALNDAKKKCDDASSSFMADAFSGMPIPPGMKMPF
jgi:DNA-binding YbaB/EbfC family protein